MSLQSVRQFFAEHAPDIDIIELNQSTATVALAAAAHHVEPRANRQDPFVKSERTGHPCCRQRQRPAG